MNPRTEVSSLGIESIKTGIDVLDAAIPKGIPRNSMVMFAGEGGTGKSVFLASIAYNRLQAGEPVLYVSLDDDPLSLVQLFQSFGWRIDEFVANGKFKVIDCFSFRIKTLRDKLNYVYKIIDPRESNELLEALIAAMNDMGMNSTGAVFIDSLNELLTQSEITSALETVRMIRATAPKTRNVPVFATLHTGIDSIQEILFTLEYTVDGVILFRHDPSMYQVGIPVRQLRVHKFRGTSHTAIPVYYSISSEGVRAVDPRKLAEILKTLQASSSLVEEAPGTLPSRPKT